MIDMIRVGQTRNLLRASSSLLEMWPRSAHHHPGQRRQSAARTGLTKVSTRSHVQKIRNSLQTERHPQKKVAPSPGLPFDRDRPMGFGTAGKNVPLVDFLLGDPAIVFHRNVTGDLSHLAGAAYAHFAH